MEDWRTLRRLGGTDLLVTGLCLGTSPLGSSPETYGYEVAEQDGVNTVKAAVASPINFIDTSNAYGGGNAERRIGLAFQDSPPPTGYVVATKVDADAATGDFSGERVMRSIEESLSRLGVSSVDILYLHDPEFHIDFAQAMSPTGAVPALQKLREQGVARYIGVATGTVSLLIEFARTTVFDVMLNHCRYTLVDRSAAPLVAECASRGIGMINAAPYGGGLLSRGPDATNRYGYAPAHPLVLEAARAIKAACDEVDVPLAAAALQFSLRQASMASTIVGVSSAGRLEETMRFADWPIPETLWPALERLLPPPEAWLR